jgi:mono/diheme cytochrome c family protein
MNLRAFTIGVSAAFLALACSGSDDNNPKGGDDGETPVTPTTPTTPGTGPETPSTGPTTPVTQPPQREDDISRAFVESLLRTNCGGCHGNEAEANSSCRAGMCYIEDIDELIANGKITPGDPNGSLLYQRISRDEMPPAGVTPRLNDDEVAKVAQYILKLETPPQEVCDDQFMSWDDVYENIERDILSEDADDRPFLRYLSISNRYNAGVCDAQLEPERWAMSKFINSISQKAQIREPEEVVGTNGTVYRIDLRDYDLDDSNGPFDPNGLVGGPFVDGWEAIINNNNFAVEFQGDAAENIIVQSNTTIPVMFSDAVIDEATVGNLYYELLRLQDNRDANLLDLEVDQQANVDDRTAIFAATTQSEISDQDRFMRRDISDAAGDQYYWESFDLDPNLAGNSIFDRPLDFNLAANGSEALFSLPNGLQAYIIYDENGLRLEESPILFDNAQNDNTLRAAVSCETCHDNGTIQFEDEVLQFAIDNRIDVAEAAAEADLDGDGIADGEFADIEELYPENADLKEQITDDATNYRAALARAGVPTNGSSPIADTFIRFDRDVRIADVAGFLHYPLENLERDIPRLDPALSGLDNGFAVDTDDFKGLYLESLCITAVADENQPADAECATVGL